MVEIVNHYHCYVAIVDDSCQMHTSTKTCVIPTIHINHLGVKSSIICPELIQTFAHLFFFLHFWYLLNYGVGVAASSSAKHMKKIWPPPLEVPKMFDPPRDWSQTCFMSPPIGTWIHAYKYQIFVCMQCI